MRQSSERRSWVVGFGSPRVGDIGFAARLRVLFDPQQLLIVMHPSDVVHAFPPTAEGYVDACIKIFLREHGMGVGRRSPGHFSLLPFTKSIDRAFEHAHKAHTHNKANQPACSFCHSKAHVTAQHRCRYCIERGSHRGANCPNRNKSCRLCVIAPASTSANFASNTATVDVNAMRSATWVLLNCLPIFDTITFCTRETVLGKLVSLTL
ncbi:hypothetical protein PsorP6_013965 [Peronosclerospora sorghi]|uniref:Uncharacterized protein n=1 Tax=Peronosclerospora sorghi TaxID=230839 RepID=A0ACC0VHD1_9STRA|nr:hypothetical protein PsorP6_013965 [Peronosclerospora sorghi]